MKNKTYIFAALVLTLGISFSVALAGSKDALPSITFGDNDPDPLATYTLTISSFDSANLDPYVSDDIYIAYTNSGYPVKFAIDKGANGGHDLIEGGSLYIGKGGYIRNHTEILGIRDITINYTILDGKTTVGRCELGNSPVDFTTSFVSDSNDFKIATGAKKTFTTYKNFMQFMCPDDVLGMEDTLIYRIDSISITYNCSIDEESQFKFIYNEGSQNYSISINSNINKASLTSLAVPATYLGKPVVAAKGFLAGCSALTSLTFEKFPISSVGAAGNVPLLYYFTNGDLPYNVSNTLHDGEVEFVPSPDKDFLSDGYYAKYDHAQCASDFRGLVPNLANIKVLSGSVGSYVFYQVCKSNVNHVVEIGKDVLTVGAHAFEMLNADSGTDELLFHQGGPTGIETEAFSYIRWSSVTLNSSILSIKVSTFRNSILGTIHVPFTEQEGLPTGWVNGWNAGQTISYRS